ACFLGQIRRLRRIWHKQSALFRR
ncbi:hypothetical protein VP68_19655, partial [Escherichia coli]